MAVKELTLDEMKAVELGILKKFDSICKENGLEYSLAYGTMLGAIRHKGFIPWDDDIDVFMKREDYEKLLALKYDDGDFEIKSYRYSKSYYFLYSKMVDKRTSICENWRAEKDMGLFVDIFPLDYCNFDGEGDKLKAQMESESKRIDRKVEIAGILGHKMSHHMSPSPRYIVKFLFKLFTFPFRRLILKRIDLMHSKNKSGNYLVENFECHTFYNTDLFSKLTVCSFENTEFPIYSEYDKILTQFYGDYMTPPPVDQQKSVHWYKAYSK